MSNIPLARAMVAIIAKRLEKDWPREAEELRQAIGYMTRLPRRRRAPTKSKTVTAAVAEAMRRRAAAQPQKSLAEIAREFGCNPGRVSEALHHRR